MKVGPPSGQLFHRERQSFLAISVRTRIFRAPMPQPMPRRPCVDGAREHRGENESQDRIERGLLGEKPAVSAADDHQRRHKHNHTAQTDLHEGQHRSVPSKAKHRIDVSGKLWHTCTTP